MDAMTRQQSDVIVLIGRLLMSLIFIMSGFSKLLGPANTIQHIAADGLPLPPAAYVVAVLCELGGGLAILLGWQTRIAAAALSLFCIVTAFTVHYHPGVPAQMVNFWKNITMAGGFLYVLAHGSGAYALDAWPRLRRHIPGHA
jgi:putative oxidoreductase